jgi:hypothetical protein
MLLIEYLRSGWPHRPVMAERSPERGGIIIQSDNGGQTIQRSNMQFDMQLQVSKSGTTPSIDAVCAAHYGAGA